MSETKPHNATPTLSLFHGSKTRDVDAIADSFKRLTGREMSDEARQYIIADIARRNAGG